MKAGGKKRKRHAAKAAWLLFALFSAFVLLFAALAFGGRGVEALPGVRLSPDLPGGAQFLMLEERDGMVWFACSGRSGALLLKLDGGTGAILARREIDRPLYWAALRGETIYAWEDLSDRTGLLLYEADSLEEGSGRELDVSPQNLLYFDCDPSGRAFAVTSEDRNTLRALEPGGKEEQRRFPEPISFFQADAQGGLCLCAGESLFFSDGWGSGFRELTELARPAVLLGRGMWIDQDGVVCRLEEEGVQPLFRTPGEVFPSYFYCLDRENCLLLSEGAGAVQRYGLSGEPLGSCQAEKGIDMLCGAGAVSRREDGLYYTPIPLEAFLPGNSPSLDPSPSASPFSSPSSGTEDLPAWVEDGLVISPREITAARMRDLLKPDVADIRDRKGEPVAQGRLSTGMTVNGRTLVVLGDCDGTGTVTGADVRQAVLFSLGQGTEEEAYRRAADLDGDGAVTSADLLGLSAMAGKKS